MNNASDVRPSVSHFLELKNKINLKISSTQDEHQQWAAVTTAQQQQQQPLPHGGGAHRTSVHGHIIGHGGETPSYVHL
jgi:hypothetical protein